MSLFHDADICRSIIDSLPAGVCVVDMQKKIVFWSHGAERSTGHLGNEVIGHSCIGEAVLHCDQPGCEFCNEDCPVARAIKTSQPAETIGFLQPAERKRCTPCANASAACWPTMESNGGENEGRCQSPSAKLPPSPTTPSSP